MRRFAFTLTLLFYMTFPALDASAQETSDLLSKYATVPGGDEIQVALTAKGGAGQTEYRGLIQNGEQVIFTDVVTQITDDRHPVHFLRNASSAYFFSSSLVVKIPLAEPLSSEPFQVVQPDWKTLPTELKDLSPWWRGIRLKTAKGKLFQVYASSRGDLYFPDATISQKGEHLIPLSARVRHPYLSLKDFRSWFEKEPPASPQNFRFHISAITPDPKTELHFDLLEIRPEAEGSAVYAGMRASGKPAVVQGASLSRAHPLRFLSVVYHEFEAQRDRPEFDQELIHKISEQDRKLGVDRMIYIWSEDQQDRVLGGIRLFQGYESSHFITKDLRLPVEREYPQLDLRRRFPGEHLFEFNRLVVRKEIAPELNTRTLASLVLAYLEARDVPHGRILMHTDRAGSLLYQRFFGAELEFGPESTADGTYILSIHTEKLAKRLRGNEFKGVTKKTLRTPHPWCSKWLR